MAVSAYPKSVSKKPTAYLPVSNNALGSPDCRTMLSSVPRRCLVGGSQRIHAVRESGKSPSPKELGAYPTGTSTCVTKTSLRNRRFNSDGSAVSKNRVSASTRFVRASSIDEPWLAISSSGHSATNPSSSRSMIAVKRCDCTMVQVYTRSLGCVVASQTVEVRQGKCSASSGMRKTGSPRATLHYKK